MKTQEEISALVEDRKTLLDGINEIVEMATNDYGTTRTTQIKIYDALRETLRKLKYESIHHIA